MNKTLRQVTFQGLGIYAGIAYNPIGKYSWSNEYYSYNNGKYTKLDRFKIIIIDNTGAFYRKVVKRIKCKAEGVKTGWPRY